MPPPTVTSTQRRDVLMASQLTLEGEEGSQSQLMGLSAADPEYTHKLLGYISKHLDQMAISITPNPNRLSGTDILYENM